MDFVPIRLRTLVPNVSLDFNVYIKVNERFLLYVRQGDDIELKRLNRLQGKKVKQLFIAAGSEESYQKFLDNALIEAASNEKMLAEDKAVTTSDVVSKAIEDMHHDPESLPAFQMLERAAIGIANVVGRRTDVLKEFYKAVEGAETELLFKHAMNIAALATCFGSFIGLPDKILYDLSTAAMLLDIGVVSMPERYRRLFTMRYEEFDKSDWDVYKTHPTLGSELLNRKTYINRTILELINEHEERKNGTGFPKGSTISGPLLQIIGLCSCYDRLITCYSMPHKDALDEVLVNQIGNFELDYIKALKKLLKVQGIQL